MRQIAIATSDEDIAACFDVMSELRPHLHAETFVEQIRHLQATTGFKVAYLRDQGIRSVAGFRISEWLAGGRYLEIEDLVSHSNGRSKGYGGELFDWLVQFAADANCREVRLVSNVRRVDAHRFYLRKGMSIEAHYFSMRV